MITYRKKGLKVENIKASDYPYRSPKPRDYSGYVAEKLQKFIGEGQYRRIADIFFFGEDQSLTCSIIYEEIRKDEL